MKINKTLEKNISLVARKVVEITVVDEKSKAVAGEMLSKVNLYNDSLQEQKQTITKPLNEALKNARALFAPLEKQCEEAIEYLRGQLGTYQTRLMLEQKKKTEEIASKVASGKIDISEASSRIGEVLVGGGSVVSESGMVKFRTDVVLEIIDAKKVPREYCVVDEKAVLKALKGGSKIAGCVLKEVQVPVNYR